MAKPLSIGHLVTPYLFVTGSWIHAQLVKARRTKPIVLTRRLENVERFPFSSIHFVLAGKGGGARVREALSAYLLGSYRPEPYLTLLAREQVRLLHAHTGWEAARSVSLARRAGLPLVVSFYGRDSSLSPRKLYWRCLYRRLFNSASAYLVEGPHLGRTLTSLGAPPERIRVVHLGIDLSAISFRVRQLKERRPVQILVSSSLREKKGVPAAVRVFAAARAALGKELQLRLRILGDGPERPKVEAEIRRLALGSVVDLDGYVPYEAHLAALASADLFLAASRTASDGDDEGGAPVALLEAQASGLPVLSTHHCDIPEVVQDGGTGLLSDENDEGALAANLIHLLRHPERWEEMGRAGRAFMEAEFSIERRIDAVEAIYEELVGS